MSVAPARRLVLRVLARTRKDAAFSGAVLSGELVSANLSAGDAALATHLTYGVVASAGILDEAIDRYSARELEPRVRDALRLGAYELLFGRAPVYAVVDQTVEAVRAVRPQAAGLANAVMRKLAGTAAEFPWGDPAEDRAALARATAHPRWIVDLFLEELGEERGRAALFSALEPAPTYIRLDPFMAGTADALEALSAASPQCAQPDPDCRLLEIPSAAFRGGAAAVGWFAMDAAAQIAPLACAPSAGMRIADVGAGRGNKTICLQSLAVRTGGPAAIVAVEIHAGKAEALGRRLQNSHVPSVEVVAADACDLASVFGRDAFDAVLVDAPCSGLGTLRRYPEKRWRLSENDIRRLNERQRALVASAAGVVRPGGRVVYSTCSVAAEENAGIVQSFLDLPEGRRFALEPLRGIVPAEWQEFVTADGCFQSWPTVGGPDGHFVAVLRRECA